MDKELAALRIDAQRFRSDFEVLGQIGATPDGGVHRPALSESHLAARAWLRSRIETAGLELRVDGAGNHSAFLSCGPAGAPTLLLGSHLDSVPHGGRFDGALGVLAALETLRVVKQAGVRLPVHLEAIDFTDEEGTLVGMLGSAALTGALQLETLQETRGGRAALEVALERAGLSESSLLSAVREPGTLAGYLELHIEQGTRLAQAEVDIGVVTSIVGAHSYRLTFTGRADHAGTRPVAQRRDAGQGASAFALASREIVLQDFPECRVNVGDMRFMPGAFNIVPAQVVLALEFRAPDDETLAQLQSVLLEEAHAQARRFGLELAVEWLGKWNPASMNVTPQQAIVAAADALGLKHLLLFSGAGHDAQWLARVCPTGMIFVPSVEGTSHSPDEFTRWEDCLNGANVLLQTALRLAVTAVPT